MLKTFYETIIGNADLGEWAASMFFAMLTHAGMLALRAGKRDKLSDRTPIEWSWKFFWRDTARQIIGTIILIFLFIRVLQFIIAPKWLVAVAVAVGLCSDLLVYFALLAKAKIREKVEKNIKEK